LEEGTMKKALIPSLLLCPLLALADTVVMRDGSRHDGTFVSGTSRTITFVEQNGARRNFDMRDVAELRFGTSTPQSAQGSTGSYQDTTSAVSRLRSSIDAAITNGSLTNRERRMLEDASATLGEAPSENSREMRMALDNIRTVMRSSNVQATDRDRVLADIRDLQEVRRDGTRNRYR
jgi:hypothetical protein